VTDQVVPQKYDQLTLQCRTRCTVRILFLYMLPTSVQWTVVLNLNPTSPVLGNICNIYPALFKLLITQRGHFS
jgi:hypothetical protein